MRAYVRKTRDWGPLAILRRCAVVSRLVFYHPVSFFKVIDALAASKFASLVRKDPIIFLKFSWPVYSNGLSTADRAVLFSTHYEFLHRRIAQPFLNKLIGGRAILWEKPVGSSNLSVCLDIAPPTYGEGELSLHFQVNSVDVYVLSFVIAPARVLGLDADHAIFITRLQGIKGYADSIKLATKSVGDVSPTLVLMAAVQGIALALGIRHVLGISAKEQVCTEGKPPTQDFISAYDEFWSSIEGKRLASGYFHFPVPLPEKSLVLIKQNHRLRVRARRLFRSDVSERVRRELEATRVA